MISDIPILYFLSTIVRENTELKAKLKESNAEYIKLWEEYDAINGQPRNAETPYKEMLFGRNVAGEVFVAED